MLEFGIGGLLLSRQSQNVIADTYWHLSCTYDHILEKSGSRRASATLILVHLRILSKHLRFQTAQNSNTFWKLFRLRWGDPKVTIRPKKTKFQDDVFWCDNSLILKSYISSTLLKWATQLYRWCFQTQNVFLFPMSSEQMLYLWQQKSYCRFC